jgi:probable rRNA maturation factor
VGTNTVLISTEENAKPPPGESVQPDESFLQKSHDFAQAVLEHLEIAGWELSVFFCSDACIQKLNGEFRGKDEPTDVLSFTGGTEYTDESGETKIAAGDIVISLDTLKKNSAEFNVHPDEELKRLLIHGILHLKGYDHEDHIAENRKEIGQPLSPMLLLQESIVHNFDTVHIIEDGNGYI